MERIAPQTPADPAPPSLVMAQDRARTFRRRLILITCVAVALVLGLAAIVGINAHSYREYNSWTRHSYMVEQQLLRTTTALRSAESGLRGYLLTADASQLETFLTQLPQVDEDSAELVRMTADNPPQQQRARQLRAQLLQRTHELKDVLQRYRKAGPSAARTLLQEQMATQSDHPVAQQTSALRVIEQQLLGEREARRTHSAMLTTWFTVACLLSGLLLLISAVALVLREQRIRLASNENLAQAYMQLANSLEESRGMADRMQRLHTLSETLQNCRSIEEAARILPPSLEDMLPDTSGTVLLINASRNLAETAAEWGTLPIVSEPVFAPDECLALRRGQPYPAPGTRVKFRCAHLSAASAPDTDATWTCVPLLAQGETLGILHVQQQGEIREDVHELVITLGEQLGLMLGNLKLQESLRIQSIRDPLTGLFNRRYLEVSLSRELLRNARHARNLALLMLDMDHFKQFNDTHGHDAGDELLQQFASLLRDTVRAEDIACRFGGEEFVVILPETDQDSALQRGEEIRQAVASMKVRHNGELLGSVTVSIGLAMQEPHGNEPAALMHAADQALYRAKRNGRNRIELAEASTERTMTKGTD